MWGSQSDARYSCGQQLSLCRFPRMSFFCACPGISPQRRSACSLSGSCGRVISHSDGHSVVRSALCPPHNQLGNRFQFERNKFCELSANDKKSRYTAHQISGRKSLAISLMKLCTGSAFQKPSMSAISAPLADSATGAEQPQSLSAAALRFIQIFSCGSLMRAYGLYHIERLFVKRF